MSSLTHSPLDSPLPEVALLSKSKIDDANSSTYPLLSPLQARRAPWSMFLLAMLVNIAAPGAAPVIVDRWH